METLSPVACITSPLVKSGIPQYLGEEKNVFSLYAFFYDSWLLRRRSIYRSERHMSNENTIPVLHGFLFNHLENVN